MIFYIILSIIVFIIIAYMIYKVKYGYWSRQPVFHYHNIFYWYNPPGVIEKGDVEISKYYNPQIDFIESSKLTTEKKEPISKTIADIENYGETLDATYDYLQNRNSVNSINLSFV